MDDPSVDLGRLLSRLESVPPGSGQDRSRAAGLAAVLFEAYVSLSAVGATDNLRLGLALGRLRLALHWLQGLCNGWQDAVRAQVLHAQAALAEQKIAPETIGPADV